MWVKRENEARFLHLNEVNLRDIETKWPSASICSHVFAQVAQRKHDLRSPIVDRENLLSTTTDCKWREFC